MKIEYSTLKDYDAWIQLAREVEPLFGPMADEISFQESLRQSIVEKAAFCLFSKPTGEDRLLRGGIVISKESNEIAWFVVSNQYRGQGYGRELLKFAISRLNHQEDIWVQTFDDSVGERKAARKLYFDFGFTDFKKAGLNPAGIPTVIMQLSKGWNPKKMIP